MMGADGKRDPTEEFWQLEIDLEPFNSHFPKLTRPSSIGEGVKFLNRSAMWHEHVSVFVPKETCTCM